MKHHAWRNIEGTPPSLDGGATQLLGRQAELAELRDAISRLKAIAVVGEAGIGKSAITGAATAGRPAWLRGGLSMLGFIPYLPLARAVGELSATDEASVARIVITRVRTAGVLVLDDLQWADEATLSLLARLSSRLRLLCAVRSGDERSAEVRDVPEAIRRRSF